MKTRTFIHSLCIAVCTALVLSGCSDEQFAAEQETTQSSVPFTLTATSGDNATSRLSFADDGLTLYWEDGDQLVMQDVDFAQSPIYLTASLDAPATSANFVSETGVGAGTYFVYYKGNSVVEDKLNIYQYPELMYDSDLKDRLFLLSTLTVSGNQTSATVNLQHLFAKLTVKFVDNEGILSSMPSKSFGMLSTNNGFYTRAQIEKGASTDKFRLTETSDRFVRQPLEYKEYVSPGGSYHTNTFTNGMIVSTLLFPQDFTGGTVFFYIGKSYISSDVDKLVAYEFPLDGKNIKAGVNYNVTLDLSKAQKYDLSNRELSSSEQFRALNYIESSDTFIITQDLDFSGVQYVPIMYWNVSINGNGHKISNLTIDGSFDGAGLIGNGGTVSNLTLENVTVKGKNYVGAFCGKCDEDISNCQLIGMNTIEGNDYVGGIVGYLEGASYNPDNISSSTSSATIKGNNYVGGIVGYLEGLSNVISVCGFSGSIEATGEYVGGIAGFIYHHNDSGLCEITKCYNTGNITGKTYIGGIVGSCSSYYRYQDYYEVSLCYSTGSVTATDGIAGGIAGSSLVRNCYSLSDVKGSVSGGICGIYDSALTNCYYAGTVESGNGIVGSGSATLTSCLTTSPSSAPGSNDPQYVNCTDILSKVDIINGDNAFSTTEVWENHPYNCPKLVWQLDPLNVGGGEGVEAPKFENEDWE